MYYLSYSQYICTVNIEDRFMSSANINKYLIFETHTDKLHIEKRIIKHWLNRFTFIGKCNMHKSLLQS